MPSPPRRNSVAKRDVSVAVVIPTYNEETIIGRTIRNLHSFLPPEVPIIVADGHSKDFTRLIAEKLGAKVILEKGRTVGSGRNEGAAAAGGVDIVWFVDADTFPTQEFYEKMTHLFSSDKRIVGVGCHIMPEDIGLLRKIFFYGLNMIVFFTVKLGRPNIAGSCVAYRKAAFDEIGGFDTETHSAEDMDLTQRISKLGRVLFLYHAIVPTSDRRVHKLGVAGLMQDWTRATIMYLRGQKTTAYYAPR